MERKGRGINPLKEKVCVIGLGTVGYPTALHISNRGFPVYGFDIDREKVGKITQFDAFSKWNEVPVCQIYVVCVTTGWKNGKPDMSQVFNVCQKISKKAKKPLICIESTVYLGTCRKIANMFKGCVHMVYVPHRYWAGDPENYGVNQLRVIGALDEVSLNEAKRFYKELEVPLYVVPSLEVAEMIKTVENAYRYVQIAFVEELRLICEKNKIPFEKVREGANTKWNVELLEARDGIKGDCLPKDTRYLTCLESNTPLLTGAIEADKRYRDYINTLKKGH